MAFCARIGISSARYLYSVIESTPSPWDSGSQIESTPSPLDSGSRIDTPSQNVGNYCIGQLSSWVQVGRSHDTVMVRRVVLGEIVAEVSAAGFPINEKLTFPGVVLDPIEAHFDGVGYIFLYVAICKNFRSSVVDKDWSWWLWVPEFLEGSAYRHGLLAVVKSGTDFSVSGGRHHVVKDIGDGMYRAIKKGVYERWLGRVSGVVAKKIVATNARVVALGYC